MISQDRDDLVTLHLRHLNTIYYERKPETDCSAFWFDVLLDLAMTARSWI